MKKTTEKRPYEKPRMRAVEIQSEQFIATSNLSGLDVQEEKLENNGWVSD